MSAILDQFRMDFCWTDLCFVGHGPWSNTYFEDCKIEAIQ